ncbi:hypothetical protein ACFQAT_05795 [Undibacterium arcticum]|uniref:P68 RBP/TagC-like beta-propeller domain-containing protein n=1 Tax=Undibacterium arcticum TaxID=1762892 RepID=A0ABV7FC78_9BURK
MTHSFKPNVDSSFARLTRLLLFFIACSVAAASSQADVDTQSIVVDVEGIPQDFAFDDSGSWVFVQSLRKNGDDETSLVTRIRLTARGSETVDATLPFHVLGHQGISIEHRTNGPVWLWGSKGGKDGGREAIRFMYKPNQSISDVESYTLFDQRFMSKNVTMPKVCYGNQTLVVRGRTAPREQYIRIFNLEQLKRGGPGDYSNQFVAEWPLPEALLSDGNPVQGIACDDKYVYILAGRSEIDQPKKIYVMTLNGQVVRKNINVTIGRNIALFDGKGKFYEPEGISVRQLPRSDQTSAYIGVLSGTGDRKTFRLWNFPDFTH